MMEITCLQLGMLGTNCYLAANGKEAVIIDPADSAKGIIRYLNDKELTLKAILLTHGHFDHIYAVNELREAYGIPVYASAREEELLRHPGLNMSARYGRPCRVEDCTLLEDGQVLEIAGMRFEVLATPGHTKGSVCYYVKEDNVLFSGDTLFMDSYGRTDFAGGSEKEIYDSIVNKLFLLPPDTRVLSGHTPPTTIAAEKAGNPVYYPESTES